MKQQQGYVAMDRFYDVKCIGYSLKHIKKQLEDKKQGYVLYPDTPFKNNWDKWYVAPCSERFIKEYEENNDIKIVFGKDGTVIAESELLNIANFI